MSIRVKLAACFLKILVVVLVYFGVTSYFSAFAQSYCGDSLRIDTFRCDFEAGTGSLPNSCTKVLVNDSYVAPCTGNPNSCTTTSKVFGSNGTCVLNENNTSCDKVAAFASCWVNPNDDPPPPPPDNDKCGAVCTSSSQCNGLTCSPAGVCYGASCDTGDPDPNHRIKVKVFNCSNNAASGVKISAWGNSCTTNSSGECVVSKGTSCNSSQLSTPVLAGKDADSSQANYYARVTNPSFERGDCGSINCNYNNSSTMSNPYREAYHIDMYGETVNTFKWQFCATSDSGANYGFNFKQINCATNAFPNITIGNTPTSGTVNSSYAWSLSAVDNGDGIDSFGAYIGAGTNPTSWTTLYFTNPSNAMVGTTNVTTNLWTCPAAGTYTIVANAIDMAGQQCSGNPSGAGVVRCASNPNDRKTFTCNPAATNCTGVSISCSGQCTNNTSNPKQARYTCTWTAPNGAADTAFVVKLRYKTNGVWGDPYYKTSSDAGSSSLFTKSGNNWTFTYNPASLAGVSDLERGFAVRVYSSTACAAATAPYGTERTVVPQCTANPLCTGPGINCGGVCSGAGYNATCTWTKPTGATNFLMQYKMSSSTTWINDTATTGNVATWTKPFSNDSSRDFRLKVKASTSCTPNADDAAGGYGTVDTITSPVCTSGCSGPALNCGGVCSGAGYNATCTWTKPTGATNFLMQYKLATSSTWTTDTANTGNVSSWTKSFSNDSSRNFRLKVKTSSSCTPNSDDASGGYGTAATITSPVCSSTCPGIAINCTNTCNGSSGYNVTCTWTKPSYANNFEMQYKNSTASSWTLESTGNVSTWSKAFADPSKARDFKLRISSVTSAATCAVGSAAFGAVASVGALTCTADAPPNLTFTPPATTCANTTLALSATASDSDGIQKVEFFYKRNSQSTWTLANSDTSSPYSYTIPANTFTSGTTYNLRAVATDNDNPRQTTTVDRNITVNTAANCTGGTSGFTINKVKTSNKAVPDSGDVVTFRIDVENTGTTVLNNLDITDTVPSYTTFRSASSTSGWNCGNNSSGTSCTLPRINSLAAGATQSVTYAVTVNNNYKQPGVNMGSSNTACASFTGQAQKCDTVNFDLADQAAGTTSISINKSIDTAKSASAPNGYAAGNLVVFDLDVRNTSSTATLSNIVLTETVPAYMTFVSGSSSAGWTCTGTNCSLSLGSTTMAAGTTRTYEFAARVRNNYVPTAGTNMTTTNEACANATSASESCDTLVVDLADAEDSGDAPTLGVTKTISNANSTPNPPYDAGEKIAFAIQIDNNNTTSLTGLSVVDNVPQYTAFDAATSNSLSPGNTNWSCNASGRCTFNAGSLNASSSKTVYFVVDVLASYTPGNGNMRTNNEACVTSTEVTTAVCDNIDADLVDAPAATNATLVVNQTLDTVKTGKAEPYAATDVVFVEITVRNNSTTPATNVVLTDTISGNKARQSVSSANSYNTGTWSCSTNKVCTYNVGNIPANTTRTYYFAEVITNYSSPIGTNATTSTEACAVGDNATQNCDDLVIDLVDNVSAPSFTINQSIVNNASSPFDANGDIEFSVEVTNTGNVQLSNVAITDQLSNLVTFNDSATTSNWSCSGSSCSINVGFLNAGATYTADIVLKVKPDYFTVGGFNYGDDAKGTNRVTATEALLPSVTDNITFDLVDLTTQPTTIVGYIHYLEEGQNCTDIADTNRLTSDKLDLVSGQNPRVLFEFTDVPPTSVNINPYSYSGGFDVSELKDIPLPVGAKVRVALSNLNNIKPSLPGEFEFPCARLNASAMGKANASRTNYTDITIGGNNTLLIGLRIKPFKPWFQLDTGDIFTGGQVVQSLPTPPSPKMITNDGNLFSDAGAFTDFSNRGVNVRNFMGGSDSTWLSEYGFTTASGDSLSGNNLQGKTYSKIYRGNAGTLNSWLSSNSSYSVSSDDLAVYFVTGSGDVVFDNPNGLTSSNNGRLLIVTKGNVIFNPSFGQNISGSIAGEFGIVAEGNIDFIHQTGVTPVPDILRLEGIFASGAGGGIDISRRCALNELQPSIIFNYDDRYYEKIIELENATSYGLGMSQVEVTNWEVLD